MKTVAWVIIVLIILILLWVILARGTKQDAGQDNSNLATNDTGRSEGSISEEEANRRLKEGTLDTKHGVVIDLEDGGQVVVEQGIVPPGANKSEEGE